MEVKSIYMDLVEGKKKGNVWKLESEAFKKPIEIKIGYDNHELAEFNSRFEEIENKVKLGAMLSRDLGDEMEIHYGNHKELKNQVELQEKLIQEQGNKIIEQGAELKELYKAIADAKSVIELQSGTILKLQEQVKELEKKVTKQPMVFSDTTFISGHERVGLGILEVPSGEYLVIEKYLLLEPNEFVENHDGIKINKITVTDNQYIPMYNLFGGTALDTPTAKVYWTLAFIPC